MEEAVQLDKKFTDFICSIKTLLRLQASQQQTIVSQKWNDADRKLQEELQNARQAFHEALLDSLNTPKCLEILQQLTVAGNTYMQSQVLNIKHNLLVSVLDYFVKALNVFGINSRNDYNQFGGQWEGSNPAITEEKVGEILDTFCSRRDSIRGAARSKASADEIKSLCEHKCNYFFIFFLKSYLFINIIFF